VLSKFGGALARLSRGKRICGPAESFDEELVGLCKYDALNRLGAYRTIIDEIRSFQGWPSRALWYRHFHRLLGGDAGRRQSLQLAIHLFTELGLREPRSLA